MTASQTTNIQEAKNRLGRTPGDRVPIDLAAAFRARIHAGMELYGASAVDIVDQPRGVECERNGKWVWAQLSPSRDLFAHNARELLHLLTHCRKAWAHRRAIERGFDDFMLEMQAERYTTFRFLIEPLPDAPVAIAISPHEVARFATILAAELDGMPEHSPAAMKNKIQRWFERHGGQAAALYAGDLQATAARYGSAEIRRADGDFEDVDFVRLAAEMNAVVELQWHDNAGYEESRARRNATGDPSKHE
jgi:hypothetical protein